MHANSTIDKDIIEKSIPWDWNTDSKDTGLFFDKRKLWTNAGGNLNVYPLKLFKPTCLEHLVNIIREAESSGLRVKAIGSKHAWSDLAVSTDYMVDTHGLNAVLPIEDDMKKGIFNEKRLAACLDKTQNEAAFQVEAGIRIRELNEALFARNLALLNMGGYDEQTIMGAASTSTHGTGITLPPVCDAILSLTIVSSGGTVIRIEPTHGITDPVNFKLVYPHIELVQQDALFHSVAVSMGTMGIIYSVILKVREAYYLCEKRGGLQNWEDVKKDLVAGAYNNYRHYDLILNPYKIKGVNNVLVSTKDICAPPPKNAPWSMTHRRFIYNLLGVYKVKLRWLFNFIMNINPAGIPKTIDGGLSLLLNHEFTERSYRVLNLGGANFVQGCSAELAVPLDKDNTYIKVIEKIFELAEKYRETGDQYLTSPVAARFVKASNHYMSMMHKYTPPHVHHKDDAENPADATVSTGSEAVTGYCLIELPVISFSVGGLEMLERIEREMYKLNARPHWGQVNFISRGHIKIHTLYPKIHTWLEAYKVLNMHETFSNEFTYRCGFDVPLEVTTAVSQPMAAVKAQLDPRLTKILPEGSNKDTKPAPDAG